MSLFSMLKRNSKLALRGFWGRAILASLIVLGAGTALSMVQSVLLDLFAPPVRIDVQLALRYGFSEYFFEQFAQTSLVEWGILALFTALELLLIVPLTLGVTHWHLQLVQGAEPGIGEIFHFFESSRRFGRSIWLYVNLFIRCLGWAVLLLALPAGILGASSGVIGMGEISRSLGAAASVGVLLGLMVLVLALFVYGALVNRYLVASYLLCESDDISVREAVRQSVRYTRGYRFSLLWFQLSFVGWALLCVFVLPALYVVPYVYTAMAMYARYIIERGRYTPADATREFRPEEDAAAPPEEPDDPEPQPADDWPDLGTAGSGTESPWAPAQGAQDIPGWQPAQAQAAAVPSPEDPPDFSPVILQEPGTPREGSPPDYRPGPLPAPDFPPVSREAAAGQPRREEEDDPAIWPEPDEPFRDRPPRG